MNLLRHWMIVAASLSGICAQAQHDAGGGYPFEVPRLRPSLDGRIAQTHFEISNLDADAQTHVNLAVEAMHGFWIYEAERHLRAVMSSHPTNPLVFALAAFAHTIFGSGDFERGLEYFQTARGLMTHASHSLTKREQNWYEAIHALYDPELSQAVLRQSQHIQILERLVAEFPEDLEAKAFLSLALWLYRVIDPSVPHAERVVLTARTDLLIDEVLRASPQHPAHHYKIHLWNNGHQEFHALDSARASGPAQSHIAHLWHMPAHIFTRTKDIYYAMRHVDVAHRVDHAQMAKHQLMPSNIHNYYHNFRDFGLNLGAATGQWSQALDRAEMMLRFGRIPHFGSRMGHAYLAVKMMDHLERYGAWEKFESLYRQGFFDGLDTGSDEFDTAFDAQNLRMRLRSLLSREALTSAQFETARALLRDLESIKNQAAVSGASNEAKLAGLFEDSRLWFEIVVRRSDDSVPRYFLEKLIELKISSLAQIILLADELGHRSLVESLAQDLTAQHASQMLPDLLNLLSFWAADASATSQGLRAELMESVGNIMQLPIKLEDFSTLKIFRVYPQLLLEVIGRAEQRHQLERTDPPDEFAYIDALDLEAMGPEHPVRPQMKRYEGVNPQAQSGFASPEVGRYKLLVFSLGPACLACNEQLQKIIRAQDRLGNLNVDTIVISSTGDEIAGLNTIPDGDHQIHRQMEVWDQFDQEPLHGLFLVDSNRHLLWHTVSQHAIEDVEFLATEFERLIRLDRSAR